MGVSEWVEQAEQHMTSIDAATAASGDSDKFLQERKSQLEARLVELRQLVISFDALEKTYAELCSWFRLDPKHLHSTDEFFGIWDSFLADVQKALEMKCREGGKSHGRR